MSEFTSAILADLGILWACLFVAAIIVVAWSVIVMAFGFKGSNDDE